MVFLVYNIENSFMTGVYEDERDAYYAINMLDETDYKDSFKVKEIPYFKKQSYKFHYSEEDNNIDEEEYTYKVKHDYNYKLIILFNIIMLYILTNYTKP